MEFRFSDGREPKAGQLHTLSKKLENPSEFSRRLWDELEKKGFTRTDKGPSGPSDYCNSDTTARFLHGCSSYEISVSEWAVWVRPLSYESRGFEHDFDFQRELECLNLIHKIIIHNEALKVKG
jgi:hypothetical protein